MSQQPPYARRNAIILSLAQAVNGSIAAIGISLGALAGKYLLPDNPEFATLPVAATSIGIAAFALPVAMLCKKLGRRNGFIIGAVIGIAGALLATTGLFQSAFAVFCLGMFLIGGLGAFVQQYRFAAADQGDDQFKSRAISWVMAGGILAAFIGPQTVLFTKDLFLPIPYAGSYIAAAALLVLGIFILAFIKPVGRTRSIEESERHGGRPIGIIMRQPKFAVALLCAIASFALMTFVMTGAPLAITHHGHSESDAVTGIQWHILAMYGPSFFTGIFIVRFGKLAVIATGLILLISCAFIALSGTALWNFWTSLILLGIGWNFGFIGATALLVETHTPEEKNTVQGFHDFVLFSCVAAASLLSGAALHKFGWAGVASFVFPIAGIGLISLFWLALTERKTEKLSEGL